MKVEIVGFYPTTDPKTKTLGTLHVYVVDLDIDIRGIRVIKKAKGFFFQIPGRTTVDEETQKLVFYPFISFTNGQKQQELIKEIQKEGKAFILQEIAEQKRKEAEEKEKSKKKKVSVVKAKKIY